MVEELMTPEFPIWTIRPNWSGGILERLEWLTDVIASDIGTEQRRALLLSPRRSWEFTVNPTRNERTFLDLVLHKMGSERWLCPLWFDQGSLSAAAAVDDTRLEFDNTYREHLTGGYALVYQDAFTWEVVTIAGQDDTGLDLGDPVEADWSRGAKVYPLRLSRLPMDTQIDALTSTVGESVLLFTSIEPNDFTVGTISDLVFETSPVMTSPPNWSNAITTEHTRLVTERDNRTGIPYRVDVAGRAFGVQSHSWIKVGRQAQYEFRTMLYALRGRQKSLWLPTFNQDIVASRNAAEGSTNLDVEYVGMTYIGGPAPGRDVVLIDGVPARLTGIGAVPGPGEERLRVAAGLDAPVVAGTRGSFMSIARLNQDSVEITHHADTDGAMECALTFQTFDNSRNPVGSVYYPIPATEMNSDPCGVDTDDWAIKFRVAYNSDERNSERLSDDIGEQVYLAFGAVRRNLPDGVVMSVVNFPVPLLETTDIARVSPVVAGMTLASFTGVSYNYTVTLFAIPTGNELTVKGQVNTGAFAYSEDLNLFGGYFDVFVQYPDQAEVLIGTALLSGSFRETTLNF